MEVVDFWLESIWVVWQDPSLFLLSTVFFQSAFRNRWLRVPKCRSWNCTCFNSALRGAYRRDCPHCRTNTFCNLIASWQIQNQRFWFSCLWGRCWPVLGLCGWCFVLVCCCNRWGFGSWGWWLRVRVMIFCWRWFWRDHLRRIVRWWCRCCFWCCRYHRLL